MPADLAVDRDERVLLRDDCLEVDAAGVDLLSAPVTRLVFAGEGFSSTSASEDTSASVCRFVPPRVDLLDADALVTRPVCAAEGSFSCSAPENTSLARCFDVVVDVDLLAARVTRLLFAGVSSSPSSSASEGLAASGCRFVAAAVDLLDVDALVTRRVFAEETSSSCSDMSASGRCSLVLEVDLADVRVMRLVFAGEGSSASSSASEDTPASGCCFVVAGVGLFDALVARLVIKGGGPSSSSSSASEEASSFAESTSMLADAVLDDCIFLRDGCFDVAVADVDLPDILVARLDFTGDGASSSAASEDTSASGRGFVVARVDLLDADPLVARRFFAGFSSSSPLEDTSGRCFVVARVDLLDVDDLVTRLVFAGDGSSCSSSTSVAMSGCT